MKKIFNKKFLSAVAVLAISGSVAMGAAACDTGNNGGGNNGVGEVVGKTYYVSAEGTGDGSSINKAAPISILNTAIPEKIQAGDTVYLLPGTYKWSTAWKTHTQKGDGIFITANGLPNGNIKIINAALDENSGYTGTDTKVTLDFSDMLFTDNNRGVTLNGNYIYWYGIDVCGAGDNGMYIGGSYNTVEYSEFYNNRDTGLQLGRGDGNYASVNEWPSFNLIKNCTSHNNYDDETYGENADGFAAKLTIGYGNVFDGCIAYRNSDDGWDLYAKSDSGNIGCVIIYNCVAFENGYLEYTQEENHNRFKEYHTEYNEPDLNSYKTRDGDGNGFKLGGSVMEGDVKMYNCLAFQNRMHGVTDNSNPGYLQIEGVTSYDNSAAIDNDPTSPTFGQIISVGNDDSHSNIDVARQTYSYNTVKKTLSVRSDLAKSLDADAYRGSVMNSLLDAKGKTYVVKGSLDADTKEGAKDTQKRTSEVDGLLPTDVFKQLPVVKTDDAYTHNIDGRKDGDRPVNEQVHAKYRNEDGSINMGELLAVKDDFDFSTYFDGGVKAGSYLNKTNWDDYTHFANPDLLKGVKDEVTARLLKAKETLTINSDEEAVYQDFEVPSQIMSCKVNWSSDSEYLTIGKLVEQSYSGSEYITIGIERPADADATATLTATISYHNRSITKTFVLNIKKDAPSIGGLQVRVNETNAVYENKGKVIIDEYRQYSEPVLEVKNGAYYNGTLLKEDQYTVETIYEYAASTKDNYVSVASFMPNHSGVFRITHNVTLADGSESASMTYQLFVASPYADVDFDGSANVSVYRDGYIIAGALTNVTGTLYTVASETQLTLTADTIKEADGVESNDFRATDISFSYANANSDKYYIYYALANDNGEITSEVYSATINKVEISSEANFMKIAGGSKVGSEEVSQTIYLLTKDLDFSSTTWNAGTSAFTGLLNGQGHTVSGITKETTSDNTGIFSQIKGGTVMNIKFDNITLSGKQRTAIAPRVYGGYFHNIAITNLMVTGTDQRTAGLIGQVYEGATPTEISQVSLVNPIPVLDESGKLPTKKDDKGNDVLDKDLNPGQLYYITGSGNRVGGIIGLIQTNNPIKDGSLIVRISDCYVSSYIQQTSGSAISNIVAEYDENGQLGNAKMNGFDFILEITACIANGVLYNNGSGRMGGMLGYHKGVGPLRVYGCISIQTEYYKGAEVTVALKNQSGTIGGFSVADVVVSGCVALMEEYNNAEFDVSAQQKDNLSFVDRLTELGLFEYYDIETKWSLKYMANGQGGYYDDIVEEPFFVLNFLGNWD